MNKPSGGKSAEPGVDDSGTLCAWGGITGGGSVWDGWKGAGEADVGGAGDSCDDCCAWGPGGGIGAIGDPVIG